MIGILRKYCEDKNSDNIIGNNDVEFFEDKYIPENTIGGMQ